MIDDPLSIALNRKMLENFLKKHMAKPQQLKIHITFFIKTWGVYTTRGLKWLKKKMIPQKS